MGGGDKTHSKDLCPYSDVITPMAWVLMPEGHVNRHGAVSHRSRDHVFILEALPLSLANGLCG